MEFLLEFVAHILDVDCSHSTLLLLRGQSISLICEKKQH